MVSFSFTVAVAIADCPLKMIMKEPPLITLMYSLLFSIQNYIRALSIRKLWTFDWEMALLVVVRSWKSMVKRLLCRLLLSYGCENNDQIFASFNNLLCFTHYDQLIWILNHMSIKGLWRYLRDRQQVYYCAVYWRGSILFQLIWFFANFISCSLLFFFYLSFR